MNKNYKSYHHRNFDYGNKRKYDTLHDNAIYLSVLYEVPWLKKLL